MFEIATQKVEYVGELVNVRERPIEGRNEYIDDTHRLMQLAHHKGQVRADLDLRNATLGVFALIGGLKYNWLLDPDAFDLEVVGRQTLEIYLAGLKLRGILPLEHVDSAREAPLFVAKLRNYPAPERSLRLRKLLA